MEWPAVDDGDRALQHILHGCAAGLGLPAGEGPAVIFDGESVARHQRGLRAGGDRKAAQEVVRLHRALAFALQLQQADGARAAGDGQASSMKVPGAPWPRPPRTAAP